jgi:putative oxidoreductase
LQIASRMSTATSRRFETADDDRPTRPIVRSHDVTRVLPLAGRILFALIFVMSTPTHFSVKGIGYATSAGVPMANVLVPLAGILALCGGLSVMLGYKAKIGAWMLVVFLIPVTLWMHRFWDVADPQMAQMQQINFMKNLALTGAALFMAYFGAGPLSLDARIARNEVTSIRPPKLERF